MQTPGGASTAVVWVAGGAGAPDAGAPDVEAGEDGLFAGVDTELRAIADLLPPSPRRDEARSLLENVQREAALARDSLSPAAVEGALGSLISMRGGLIRVGRLVATGEGPESAAAALIAEKLSLTEGAILAAAGVAVDARVDRERVVPGESVDVTLSVWNSGRREVSLLEAEVVGGEGWSGGSMLDQPAKAVVAPAELAQWARTTNLDPDSPPTLPYFLTRKREGDFYHWSEAEGEGLTRAFGPAELTVELTLEVDGTPVRTSREVVYAFADQARGEVRRPLQVVPALEVTASPNLVLRPRGENGPSRIEVRLRSNAAVPLAGSIVVDLPPDWPRAAAVPFAIADAGGGAAAEVRVEVPAAAPPGRYRLPIVAVLDSGELASGAFPTTEYEHVRPRPRPEPSVVELEVLDLEQPAVERVAWVRGASDTVADALTELGLTIDVLGARGVADADLAAYEVVVIGSRAYETDAALGRVNEKLLDYARAGGTLIVQYQQYQFSRGGFAPYDFEIDRPHDRITDETSPVRLLVPEHPVFNHPNRLTAADWERWVQERGLYFGGSWGPELTPLLALQDPGEEEVLGGLLIAPLGAGTYVYTGLSFFREIPAGVPGAYRLLANLLALGEK